MNTMADATWEAEGWPQIRLVRLDETDADAVHAELLGAGLETRFSRDRSGVHCRLIQRGGNGWPIVNVSAASIGDAIVTAYRAALDQEKVAHCSTCGDLFGHWIECDDGEARCEACDAAQDGGA